MEGAIRLSRWPSFTDVGTGELPVEDLLQFVNRNPSPPLIICRGAIGTVCGTVCGVWCTIALKTPCTRSVYHRGKIADSHVVHPYFPQTMSQRKNQRLHLKLVPVPALVPKVVVPLVEISLVWDLLALPNRRPQVCSLPMIKPCPPMRAKCYVGRWG